MAQEATFNLPEEYWDRWHNAAKQCGDAGAKLRSELAAAEKRPTRQTLERAAQAARLAESILTGETQIIANAVAAELEDAAAHGSVITGRVVRQKL